MSSRDLEQDSAHLDRIAVISHADFDHDAAQGVGARPILDDAGYELGIRNDDARPVKGLDLGCANTNAPHPSFFSLHHDRIADADRPLGQQDETGYEVGDDGLQAKTDANRKRAGNQGDLLQIETESRKGNADRRDRADIAEDGDDRQLKAWLQSGSGQQLGLEPALDNACNNQEEEQQEGGCHHRFKREVEFADLESERNVANRVEQVGSGYFPRADDQEERSQDQHHANACREQRAAERERAGADAETGSKRLAFGALL